MTKQAQNKNSSAELEYMVDAYFKSFSQSNLYFKLRENVIGTSCRNTTCRSQMATESHVFGKA